MSASTLWSKDIGDEELVEITLIAEHGERMRAISTMSEDELQENHFNEIKAIMSYIAQPTMLPEQWPAISRRMEYLAALKAEINRRGRSRPKMSAEPPYATPSLPAPGRGRGRILQILRKIETQQVKEVEDEDSTPGHGEGVKVSTPGPSFNSLVTTFAEKVTLNHQKVKEVEDKNSTPGHGEGVKFSTPGPSFNSLVTTFAEKVTLHHQKVKQVENEDSTPGHGEGVKVSTPGPSFNSLVTTFAEKVTLNHQKVKQVENEDSTPGHGEGVKVSTPGPSFNSLVTTFAEKVTLNHQKVKEVENEDSTPGHGEGVKVSTPGPSFNSLVTTFAEKVTLNHQKVKEVEDEDSTPGHGEGVKVSTPGPSFNSLVTTFAEKVTLNHQKGVEDNLKWYFATASMKVVNLEYLDRLLTEPVGDTEAIIESFTQAQSTIKRLNIELARVRVLLDCGSKIDAMKSVSAILQANAQIPDGALEWEKEIISCQLYWFNIIQNQMLGLEHEPSTNNTPAATSSWSNTYVKALFNKIFSVKGCKRALACLLCASCEDDHSMENLELLFLKAQVLGKLRYLEQWPASRWQEEEALIVHVIRHLQPLSTKWAARAQVYLAEFLRLRGYRRFLEMRKCVSGYVGIEPKINEDYQRSMDLLQFLERPLEELHLVEAMVWRAEQLFRMPSRGDWDDMNVELAQASLTQATSRSSENAYTHRVMALYLEKLANTKAREKMAHQQSWGEKIDRTEDDEVKEMKRQALVSYDAAIEMGSTMAKLERAGFLYRLDRSRDMLPVLQGLPDAGLHIAAYLTLCKNNTRKAQQHLQPFLKDSDMYPPLLVHYPVCTPLHEPINLARVVNSDAGNSSFLQTRKEILDESTRLTANKKFRSKAYVKGQFRKQAYPKRN